MDEAVRVDGRVDVRTGKGKGVEVDVDRVNSGTAIADTTTAPTAEHTAGHDMSRESMRHLRPSPARLRLPNAMPSLSDTSSLPPSTAISKTIELEKRIAQLEAKLSAQMQMTVAATSDREAALEAQKASTGLLSAVQIERRKIEAEGVQRQYESAVKWGKTIRDDLKAQLELIRTLKGAY